jgi:hypothetical protein
MGLPRRRAWKRPERGDQGCEEARLNHRFRQVSGQFVDLGSKAKMPSASVVLTAYCRRRQYAVNRRGSSWSFRRCSGPERSPG